MIVDLRRPCHNHSPLNTDGSSVEIVKCTKFFGVRMVENLSQSLNTSSITKEALQLLYFLQSLRQPYLPPPILITFYRGTIERILISCIIIWYGNLTISDCKIHQQIMRIADKIRVSPSSIMNIYTTHCIHKTTSIKF